MRRREAESSSPHALSREPIPPVQWQPNSRKRPPLSRQPFPPTLASATAIAPSANEPRQSTVEEAICHEAHKDGHGDEEKGEEHF